MLGLRQKLLVWDSIYWHVTNTKQTLSVSQKCHSWDISSPLGGEAVLYIVHWRDGHGYKEDKNQRNSVSIPFSGLLRQTGRTKHGLYMWFAFIVTNQPLCMEQDSTIHRDNRQSLTESWQSPGKWVFYMWVSAALTQTGAAWCMMFTITVLLRLEIQTTDEFYRRNLSLKVKLCVNLQHKMPSHSLLGRCQ